MNDLIEQLCTNKLFSLLTRANIEDLLKGQTPQSAAAGSEIVSADAPMDDHLVLLDGRVEIVGPGDERDGVNQTLAADSAAKQIAVLAASVAHRRVRAVTPVTFLRIDGDRADEMLGWNLQIADAMKQVAGMDGCAEAPMEVGVLKKLPPENLAVAFRRMKPVDFAAGDTVIKQGEKGDRYFVVENGTAEVWQTDPFSDETSCVAVLGPGDSFGEEALLQDGMRNATVKMETAGRMLTLTKEDFAELVQPGLLEEFTAERAREMVESGKARWIDCRYDAEYEDARIPGAPLMPLNQLRDMAHTLDPGVTYIVYCRSGRRSKAAAFLLRERNFQAYSMIGGIKNWPYEVDDSPLPA